MTLDTMTFGSRSIISTASRPRLLGPRIGAPWLPRERAVALAEGITAAPRWFKARSLGERLGLTDQERDRLGMEKIQTIDVSDEGPS
jgi:hypothetical protein